MKKIKHGLQKELGKVLGFKTPPMFCMVWSGEKRWPQKNAEENAEKYGLDSTILTSKIPDEIHEEVFRVHGWAKKDRRKGNRRAT